MPFQSKAQMRYLYYKHPSIAKRWSKEYGKDYLSELPEHKKKKRQSDYLTQTFK